MRLLPRPAELVLARSPVAPAAAPVAPAAVPGGGLGVLIPQPGAYTYEVPLSDGSLTQNTVVVSQTPGAFGLEVFLGSAEGASVKMGDATYQIDADRIVRISSTTASGRSVTEAHTVLQLPLERLASWSNTGRSSDGSMWLEQRTVSAVGIDVLLPSGQLYKDCVVLTVIHSNGLILQEYYAPSSWLVGTVVVSDARDVSPDLRSGPGEWTKWLTSRRDAVAIGATSAAPVRSVSFNSPSSLSQRCEAGSIVACSDLALMYQQGQGVPTDPVQAAALARRACEGGSATSCAQLGYLYYTGEGVPRDVSAAVSLYQHACSRGNDLACESLERLSAP